MSCRIYQRVVDERSGRMIEEFVTVYDEDYAPRVALAAFFDAEDPVAGTYVAVSPVGAASAVYEPSGSRAR